MAYSLILPPQEAGNPLSRREMIVYNPSPLSPFGVSFRAYLGRQPISIEAVLTSHFSL